MTVQPDNLVIEGGGVHGIAYIGALQYLQDCGGLCHFARVAGSSIGCLMAVAVACKVPAAVLYQDALSLNKAVLTGNPWRITALCNAVRRRGMYNLAAKGLPWMRWLMQKYAGHQDATFSDVELKYGTRVYMTLYNVTRGKVETFGPETHPNVALAEAIVAGMSFPGFFQPQKIPTSLSTDLYIDGGIVDNFPIHLFDAAAHGGDGSYNSKTLGLRTTSDRSLYFSTAVSFHPPAPASAQEYYSRIASMMMEAGQQRHERERDAERTVFLVVPHTVFSLDFDLSPALRQHLFDIGYDGMMKRDLDESERRGGFMNTAIP